MTAHKSEKLTFHGSHRPKSILSIIVQFSTYIYTKCLLNKLLNVSPVYRGLHTDSSLARLRSKAFQCVTLIRVRELLKVDHD